MEKLITVSIRGFDTNGSPLPYGDPNREREVTYPHMEMVNHCHCFHMGIEKFTIPVSI